jgi:hypothetical protein
MTVKAIRGQKTFVTPGAATATGGFNGAKVYGLNQGGSGAFVRIESGADLILGTTGAWPAMSTAYDSAGYWVAANKRFEIPDDGLYMIFHNSYVSFDGGYVGIAGDADGFELFFSSNSAALIQPRWTPNVVGVNGALGSFSEIVPLVAGDWVNLTFDNQTLHAMTWPLVEFGIHRMGS